MNQKWDGLGTPPDQRESLPEMERIRLAWLFVVVAGIILALCFCDYYHLLSTDHKWAKIYPTLLQKAHADWNRDHPWYQNNETEISPGKTVDADGSMDIGEASGGARQYDPFVAATPDLADALHDPRNWGSFWYKPGSIDALWFFAALWILALGWILFPSKVALAKAGVKLSTRRLCSWIGAIPKDDWFKIALISSIILAAIIIAVSLHWKSSS